MFFQQSKKTTGEQAEALAIAFLKRQGLRLIAQNYQPKGRGVADLDIVMQDRAGTVVFVEVRMRSSNRYGGAAGSISLAKKRRIIQAAQVFLQSFAQLPDCRFDVVVFEQGFVKEPEWIQGAFTIDG